MPENKSGKKGPDRPGGGGAFMKPVQPDDALAAVVGSDPLPRTEITKRVWDYIRDHNLQDSADKRMIRTDDKLRKICDGKAEVSMFELTKLVNSHVKTS